MQYAGVAALQGKADAEIEAMIAIFAKRREVLCGLLKDIPQIDFCEPKGAFYVMCNIAKTGKTADAFAAELLEKKLVAVVPCTSFGAPEYVRLSYACSEADIKKALGRIKEFCEEL